MSTLGLLESLGRDYRHALRGLLRRPSFTLAAGLTLALGIGATTAIFSVVYSVLIKPLPYPNADELVSIRNDAPGIGARNFGVEPTMYLTYRDENRTFASIGLWQEGAATLIDRGDAERIRTLRVTHGTLQALGVQPLRGRWFTEAEHEAGAEGPTPVILTHAFWQRRLGGDEAVLGRRLSIDAEPAEVVGIMPPDFRFLGVAMQPDLIVAVRLAPPAEQVIRGSFGFQAVVRLAFGVTLAEAQADAERMLALWHDAWPLFSGLTVTREDLASLRLTPVVRPLKDDLVGGVASTLWLLMGAIGAVLLVACANIANLMLVRTEVRRHELAVRAALGAVPARIARELLAESSSLGMAGGVVGLVLAYAGLQVLVGIAPGNLPRLEEIALHPPVLAFTLAVSLASTLLFGSITALKHARAIDTPTTLGARGASTSRERSVTRSALVVVQVALALVLVVSAGLMIRTFQTLRDVDPGFSDPASIQTARIWIPTALFPDPRQYTRMQREILDEINALRGVAAAGFASQLPMEWPPQDASIVVEGQAAAVGSTPPRKIKYVSPGYFDAMGTRIVAGRDIAWSDIEAGGRVALISEEFARELAAEPAGALGKRIRAPVAGDAWREVVGVVQSGHEAALHQQPESFVYWPTLLEEMYGNAAVGSPAVTFAIRSERAGTASLAEEVRRAIRSVDESIPITSEGTMQVFYSNSLARTSFALVMLAIAGGMALLLGIVGIYGVLAYVVSQRAREIGIRSALGAERRQLERMFLLQGLGLGGLGVAVGLVVAAASGRWMSALLFGVEPLDPAAYLAAVAAVLTAATLASYLPARRAAAIDPMETLKAE